MDSYEEIKERILSDVSLTDRREGSFVNDMVSPMALELEKVYQSIVATQDTMFVNTSTGIWLDKRGAEYAIHRKEGTYANGICTFTGQKNSLVSAGSICSTLSGLIFIVQKDYIIGENGTVDVDVKAQEIGGKYNVLPNSIILLPVGINGVSGVTNKEKILGGSDVETDDELAQRILEKLQKPATSGNIFHYRQWAKEVNGVGEVKVFPLDNGPGTVTVMPITNTGRSPNSEILQKVKENIENNRPIGATVTVTAPTEKLIAVDAVLNISPSTSIDTVKKTYEKVFQEYIRSTAFRSSVVDFYRCLSMFYDIDGVDAVQTFTLNKKTENIHIAEREVQVAGTIQIKKAGAET